MRPKQIHQSTIRVFVFMIAIVLFTSQAFCAAPESKTTSAKPQEKNQAQKKTAPAKPTKTPLSFRPDMPLREAVDILRNSTVPPLNIVVLWKDLDEKADITEDTPIGITGIPGATIKTHLNLLLLSLSTGGIAKLGYTIEDGVIIIATKDSLAQKMVTRTYDISDLVAPPSGTMMPGIGMGMGIGMGIGMGMPFGGMMPYGMNGMLGGISSAYPNLGYPNQGYTNQGIPNQGYLTPGNPNQNYLYQGVRPYNYSNVPQSTGIGIGF
jgi:hypothetical protein